MTRSDGKTEREARLAAALRANLRRRKAHGDNGPAPATSPSADDPPPQRPIA